MITFDIGTIRFNYRVAGVALSRDAVLLTRNEEHDWWFLPGGRAEAQETSIKALKREMQEELGTQVHVDRLLWIVESFFGQGKRRFHEIALYFLMSFVQGGPGYQHEPFRGPDPSERFIFQWHPLNTLKSITLYPSFLQEGLTSLPGHPVHRLDVQ